MKTSAAAILLFFLILLTIIGLGYFASGFFPKETYNELINDLGFNKSVQQANTTNMANTTTQQNSNVDNKPNKESSETLETECPSCGGTGKKITYNSSTKRITCPQCNGRGAFCIVCGNPGDCGQGTRMCQYCAGYGQVDRTTSITSRNTNCPYCGGDGKITI